ncbi:beta-lactamase-like protein [Cyathus striatus]|nr:beta-lactamase-like protein [Cyathus striatus]
MVVATSPTPSSPKLELIFLGTGTSSSLPHVDCLTRLPDMIPCKTCLSTLTPEGKKNIRRNTSVALRTEAKDGRQITIVIDAGKNFQAAAVEWFPKYGLRRIDALLITHAHADAMNGLDDLRGWTLRGAVQSHIDVYVSQETFSEVQRSFPYLVSKEYASGGGDASTFYLWSFEVPEFKWHLFDDRVPFEIQDTGIDIMPFAVHHGRVFSAAPPAGCVSTPDTTLPPTPVKKTITLQGSVDVVMKIHPYLSYGFKIRDQVAYISDVSHIPEEVWAVLERRSSSDSRRLPMVVLDCLRLRAHTSHVGLGESIEMARRMNGSRTYLTGFGHEVSHEEYITIGEIIGGIEKKEEELTGMEKAGAEIVGKERGLWVRPGHDGLRVFVERDGMVWDESYDC